MATDKEVIDSLKRDWTFNDYYNFDDLNRVETATNIVKGIVTTYRGVVVTMTNVMSRTESSIEFADSLNRIEDNIFRLKQTFPPTMVFEDSKLDWEYNAPFDFLDANRLESDLYKMYYHIENNINAIPYCGQITAGQQGVF